MATEKVTMSITSLSAYASCAWHRKCIGCTSIIVRDVSGTTSTLCNFLLLPSAVFFIGEEYKQEEQPDCCASHTCETQ